MLRPWHYSLVVDKDSPQSIHHQLTEHFRTMIEGGTWLGGSALPSSRDIAQRLGINRKTVSRVYEELSAQGLIYTQPKRGTFVSETTANTPAASDTRTPALLRQEADSPISHLQQLILKTNLHHIRRAALHMHKLRPHDYDRTGLYTLKHMLANLLAHERRFLVSPEHIVCGDWLMLQHALIHSIQCSGGLLLADHALQNSDAIMLEKHGIQVLRLASSANTESDSFVEQIEKYCINYPVAALWCDTSSLHFAAGTETGQAAIAHKLADYGLLLIDDQRYNLPCGIESAPLSGKYDKSLMLGSLYADFCDTFNLYFIASQPPFSMDAVNMLQLTHQLPSLLNMLAQSELIKRGEYKKILAHIHRFLQQSQPTG